MIKYFKDSFSRKIARRITKDYPAKIETFNVDGFGKVEFANWDNPLVIPRELDSNLISFFKQFIKEGDFCIDIGANIGDTTVPMALCNGKDGITLGFDPNPYVYKILEVNASLNIDKTNIVPVPFAISEREEEFYFISSEASFSNGGISTDKSTKHGKFIHPDKIKGVNLEDYLNENYKNWLPKFSFIKIDTEGYDKEILKSIRGLIKQFMPTIVAESFGKSTDAEKIELYEVIEQMGYDIYYFDDFFLDTDVKKLNEKKDILNYKQTINIYAKPKLA